MAATTRIALAAGLVSALTATAGLAAEANYVGDNHSWKLTCNASGYKLTSKYPVSRFIEAGADSSSTEEIETIFFGRSCDAQHKIFGKGKWCQANGGFSAEFENYTIGFSRQELGCSDGSDLGNCGC
jgi:hypothetical protein